MYSQPASLVASFCCLYSLSLSIVLTKPPLPPPSPTGSIASQAAALWSVSISGMVTDISHLQSFQISQEVWVEGICFITKFDILARSLHLPPRATQK